MATPLQQTLDDVMRKISLLEERIITLSSKCEELQKANDDLSYSLSLKEKALDKAKTDIEYLTLSHRLADSPDTLIEARRQITSLIRRVEKAIRLATDDPSL